MSDTVADAEVRIRKPDDGELSPPELTFRGKSQTGSRRTKRYVTYMISAVKGHRAGKRNREVERGWCFTSCDYKDGFSAEMILD